MSTPALIFDLDGTLVDSVYQHVLAWHEALQEAGVELAVWRIHRVDDALCSLVPGLRKWGSCAALLATKER